MSDLTKAIAAHVASFGSLEDGAHAERLFRRSAIETAAALNAGVSPSQLALEIKRAVRDIPRGHRRAQAYTSASSIGYHARVGRLLLRPEPAPELHGHGLQRLVSRAQDAIGARRVDTVIAHARSQREAHDRLVAATTEASQARHRRERWDMLYDATEGACRDLTSMVEVMTDLVDHGEPMSEDAVDAVRRLLQQCQAALAVPSDLLRRDGSRHAAAAQPGDSTADACAP